MGIKTKSFFFCHKNKVIVKIRKRRRFWRQKRGDCENLRPESAKYIKTFWTRKKG